MIVFCAQIMPRRKRSKQENWIVFRVKLEKEVVSPWGKNVKSSCHVFFKIESKKS